MYLTAGQNCASVKAMEKNIKTLSLFAVYLATIPLANWFINNVGTVGFPGGPHTIPVGFGYQAPSGVLLIGFALFARDLLQERAGRKAVLLAIMIGLPLSVLVNPAVAFASTVAFGVSEMADFAVYDRLRQYSKSAGIFFSGVVGGVVDSMLFLWLAFGSIQFWQGQVIGKIMMTLVCLFILRGINAVSKRMSAV